MKNINRIKENLNGKSYRRFNWKYRLLKLLVTPFNKTKAYQMGIIDAKGKVLIKKINSIEKYLQTKEQKQRKHIPCLFVLCSISKDYYQK